MLSTKQFIKQMDNITPAMAAQMLATTDMPYFQAMTWMPMVSAALGYSPMARTFKPQVVL